MSPTTALHGPGNASPRVLLCVGTPLGAGCSPSATSPGMWVNTMAEVDGGAGGRAELPSLVAPAALGSLCPSLASAPGGQCPCRAVGRRGLAHLRNELLLVQQVDLGQAVLLLQHQREVGDAADGQLLLQCQHDVLGGTGVTRSSGVAPVRLTHHPV